MEGSSFGCKASAAKALARLALCALCALAKERRHGKSELMSDEELGVSRGVPHWPSVDCCGHTPAVSAGTAFERCLFGHVVVKSLILFTLTNFSHPSSAGSALAGRKRAAAPEAHWPSKRSISACSCVNTAGSHTPR